MRDFNKQKEVTYSDAMCEKPNVEVDTIYEKSGITLPRLSVSICNGKEKRKINNDCHFEQNLGQCNESSNAQICYPLMRNNKCVKPHSLEIQNFPEMNTIFFSKLFCKNHFRNQIPLKQQKRTFLLRRLLLPLDTACKASKNESPVFLKANGIYESQKTPHIKSISPSPRRNLLSTKKTQQRRHSLIQSRLAKVNEYRTNQLIKNLGANFRLKNPIQKLLQAPQYRNAKISAILKDEEFRDKLKTFTPPFKPKGNLSLLEKPNMGIHNKHPLSYLCGNCN